MMMLLLWCGQNIFSYFFVGKKINKEPGENQELCSLCGRGVCLYVRLIDHHRDCIRSKNKIFLPFFFFFFFFFFLGEMRASIAKSDPK
jgi:hypothetical protein